MFHYLVCIRIAIMKINRSHDPPHLCLCAKGPLNNNLYKTQELAYVLISEELREAGPRVAVTSRTLLVGGDEHLERISGATVCG
jgi:hypothetical protein